MLPAVGQMIGTIRSAATSVFFWLGEKWGTTLLVNAHSRVRLKRQ
jgi:hypothetical protein